MFGYYFYTHTHIYIYIYSHLCIYKHMCMLNFWKNIGICLRSHSPRTLDHKHTKRYVDEMKLFGPSIWVFILDYCWAIYLVGSNKTQLGQYMSLIITLVWAPRINGIDYTLQSLNQNINFDPKKNDKLWFRVKKFTLYWVIYIVNSNSKFFY